MFMTFISFSGYEVNYGLNCTECSCILVPSTLFLIVFFLLEKYMVVCFCKPKFSFLLRIMYI